MYKPFFPFIYLEWEWEWVLGMGDELIGMSEEEWGCRNGCTISSFLFCLIGIGDGNRYVGMGMMGDGNG